MTIPITQSRLLAEFKAGDQSATEFICTKYMRNAKTLAFAITKDERKAQKIAELAIQRLRSSRQEIPDGSSILAFVFKFTREAAERR